MRRWFLHVLIGSVGLSALLGILALLSKDFGETEAKVLLSTLCVAGASILSLACAAALERGGSRAFVVPGIGTSILGFALFLVGIWGEVEAEGLWKAASTLVITGTFCAHASLLLLARLAARYAWVRPATIGATALLGALLVQILWAEDAPENVWRILGILAILGTAGTILTAVFQRMSRAEHVVAPETAGTVRCPHCGKPLPDSILAREAP
jgi:hypothetical protein